MDEEEIYNKAKCSHCGYDWQTKSKLKLVTCPSCGYKAKVLSEDEEFIATDD